MKSQLPFEFQAKSNSVARAILKKLYNVPLFITLLSLFSIDLLHGSFLSFVFRYFQVVFISLYEEFDQYRTFLLESERKNNFYKRFEGHV